MEEADSEWLGVPRMSMKMEICSGVKDIVCMYRKCTQRLSETADSDVMASQLIRGTVK